jgi:tetratricopeptide (TPR) repeat protein
MHMAANDTRAASAEIESAIRQNPSVAVWYEMKGDLTRTTSGNAAEAAAAYAKGYELAPLSGLLAKLCTALLAQQPPDCQGAADRLAAGAERAGDPMLHELHAAALKCLGRPEEAVTQLRLAHALRAKNPQFATSEANETLPWFVALATVYPVEQSAEAEKLVIELTEGKPGVLECRGLARIWVRSGKDGLSRALEFQRQAVTLCPAGNDILRASLNNELASYLITAGEMRAAAEAYDVVVRLQPTNAGALNNLAYIKAEELDDAAGALPLAERLLQIAPQEAPVLDTVGWVYFKNGDLEKARQHLSASLAILPLAETYVHLAAVLAKAGDAPGAEKQLQEAEKMKPNAETQQKIQSLRDDIQKSG